MKFTLLFAFLILIFSKSYSQGNFNIEWTSPDARLFYSLCESMEKNNNIPEVIFEDASGNFYVYDGATKNLKYTYLVAGSQTYYTFTNEILFDSRGNSPNSMKVDLDNDGIYDFVNKNSSNTNIKFYKGSNGQLIYDLSIPQAFTDFVLFDIDNDGFVELCVRTSANKLVVYSTPAVTNSIQNNVIQNKNFNLKQNYPNPFNSSSIIEYDLDKSSDVKLVLYDLSGKEVKTLVNDSQSIGRHKLILDSFNLSSGVYFYELTVNGNSDTRKMIVLK